MAVSTYVFMYMYMCVYGHVQRQRASIHLSVTHNLYKKKNERNTINMQLNLYK